MGLRQIRLARGLTQKQLADKAGVEQATISNLENGNIKAPSWESIGRLAAALQVEPTEIFPLSTQGVA